MSARNCFGPLEIQYDYAGIKKSISREKIAARERNLWRYRELLPIDGEPRVGLYSGFTPLVRAQRLGAALRRKEALSEGRLGQSPDLFLQRPRRFGGDFQSD